MQQDADKTPAEDLGQKVSGATNLLTMRLQFVP